MEMQDKINFLESQGYEVSKDERHVTKFGSSLCSSVNFAYRLALEEKIIEL